MASPRARDVRARARATDLWLPPDPKRLAAEPYTAFHDFEIEAGRANTIRRAAARAAGLERFAQRTPAEATRALMSLPGIGAWTAAMVTAVSLGDVDAVPIGDYGIPGMVGHVLAGERDADDARMLELLEPFAPQRGRAIRLIALAGNQPGRRAPRAPGRPLRGLKVSASGIARRAARCRARDRAGPASDRCDQRRGRARAGRSARTAGSGSGGGPEGGHGPV